jgi:hypothetical protein
LIFGEIELRGVERSKMIQITMQITDRLAQRLQPMSEWLPTILELSLVGFKKIILNRMGGK